jgi:hypothetical protein
MTKKQEEKSQEHKDDAKKVMKVSSPTVLILKHPQHYKKKHNTLPIKKHTLSLTKHSKHTANTTTTTTTSIQYTQASQLIKIDYCTS